jgi:glycosyltransferase involved in cell wall biosynthesis
MWVDVAEAGDWTVREAARTNEKVLAKVRRRMDALPRKLFRTGDPIAHSSAWLPSNWLIKIHDSDADLVHLHWVAGDMLSIKDIGAIRKPIVWTLHDMWAFCGAEHYSEELRWKEGYLPHNRPSYESGFDLNRWTWERKRKHWTQPMEIVVPSMWLAGCVLQSALMAQWPVTVISNTLDVDVWKPVEKLHARTLLNLPGDAHLLLFGAIGGGADPRKGYDILLEGLKQLSGHISRLELVVFGQLRPKTPPVLGFPIRYLGHLHDDVSLRLLYSAVDALVVPSRLEAFGQTASEAHACGTPVIAFDTCGLPDIVDHEQTGYLAQSFDPSDLSNGIQWVLADERRLKELGHQARQKAVEKFAYSVVAKQYQQLYQRAVYPRS